ncbi:AMP-dependent synthetase/ligase [Metarhizium album ARSEF 1941]|uniref:Very long-chain fatty acid transport protein n=1 Tax=Metarhizium album (strain ARSEF 1941) TaxID=1081103 RepID=A0A0B2WNC5_METAS|nr:AMP-dependent synthetase/ligase [Metarhizium album ARSEF 1941]KHN95453.1 AMP-dependent synthetase/ligase [Metarhizium album ARSEF 1941]
MPLPLAVAVPATAAAFAYANARTSLWYDYLLFKSAFKSASRVFLRQYRGNLSVFHILEERAKHSSTANKDLLVFEGRHHTYAQVYDKALRYGTWLRSNFGIKPKDVVAMNFENSDIFIFVWLGLWSIGAKPAFINYNLTGKPLAHCVKASGSKICLVDPNVAANLTQDVQSALSDVKFVFFTRELEAQASATAPVRVPDSDLVEDDLSNLAILIYTSGTTGLPKPAVVSWAKIIAGGTIVETLLARGGKDIMYTSMPLYHSAASVLSFCSTMLAGSTQAIGRKFSTKVFWTEVRESNATIIQYVGETLRYLLAAPPQYDAGTGECMDKKHKVTAAFGNGLRPDIWNQFKDRFGVDTILEFYAATEGPFGVWNLSRNDHTAGAIGRSGLLYGGLQSLSLSVVEVDWATDLPKRDAETGFCTKVKPGAPGELICKLDPDNVSKRFQGYYGNEGATSSKIVRGVFKPGDAWFRTGDVTRWDAEGRIYFVDRIGDTFRWKSENVSTAEVSEAVGRHPSVREANVYGVELPHHDGRAGCVAIAFDKTPDQTVLRSLASHVKSSLPRYAQPLFLRVLDDVGGAAQTTGTMKQQKHLLRLAGVKPGNSTAQGELYWLHGDTYVPFQDAQWRELEAGRVKL